MLQRLSRKLPILILFFLFGLILLASYIFHAYYLAFTKASARKILQPSKLQRRRPPAGDKLRFGVKPILIYIFLLSGTIATTTSSSDNLFRYIAGLQSYSFKVYVLGKRN